MLHSESRRRLDDMLAGWVDRLDACARRWPEHSDKYYAESESVYSLQHLALDLPYGNDLAVASFVADHVLPLLLEGK